MEQVGVLGGDADSWRKGDGKGILLAILMTLIVSGLLPIFSIYSRPSTWGIWAALFILIILFSRDLPLGILFRPIMPYYIWLLGFIIWGIIVSPVPALTTGLKAAVTTLVIAIAMAIITSRLLYLNTFANAIQVLIIGNLLMIPLMGYSSKFNYIVTKAVMQGAAYEAGISRFDGSWGNPNMTGYMCLIAIILSIWATPILAWAGRLSSIPIIYFTSSRKTLLLLLLFILMNIILVQRHNLNRLFLWAMAIIMLGSLFLLSDGLLRQARTRVAGDSSITRMLDITESNTARQGGETRMDLLQQWLQAASKEPWYGYGFGAMGGRLDSDGRVISNHLPTMGSHNTYVGVYIEAGIVGFVTFILVLLYYTKAYLGFRGANVVRWALFSLFACNIIFLVVSHNHLFSFEGKAVYALLFLLPTCPALKKYAFES